MMKRNSPVLSQNKVELAFRLGSSLFGCRALPGNPTTAINWSLVHSPSHHATCKGTFLWCAVTVSTHIWSFKRLIIRRTWHRAPALFVWNIKNWEWPGYEASINLFCTFVRLRYEVWYNLKSLRYVCINYVSGSQDDSHVWEGWGYSWHKLLVCDRD